MDHTLLSKIWSGIRRAIGTAQKRKTAATIDNLKRMLAHVPDSASGSRDRALLLLGFGGAFRRSEWVALNVEDVEYVPEGFVITVRTSKTDQECAGQQVAIASGDNPATCAVEQPPLLAGDSWDHGRTFISRLRSLGSHEI